MRSILTTFVTIILLTSCISTAKISDFSQTSSTIDFDKYSNEFKLTKTPFWTSKTSNEYYLESIFNIDETKLIEAIKKALKSYKYNIDISNVENNCIIGKRGMMANEWSSITAVYYKIQPSKIQIYINTKISQDITGGWRENRAMKVGHLIEQNINYKNTTTFGGAAAKTSLPPTVCL
jgi:hypothetical protein